VLRNIDAPVVVTVPGRGWAKGLIGQLVFSTPGENFCKCFYRKKLAAKRQKIKNEQKCAGFERVLNKSIQVLRRNERILCIFLTDIKY
jgi:hypothetical protein